MNELIDDPFEILGVTQDASQEAIRARYLELVKEFPPERDAERFRQIQAAYAAAEDPLRIARGLLQSPDLDDPPAWSDVINEHEKRSPDLNVDFLLSLGNRNERYSSESSLPSSDSSDSDADSTVDENSQQVFVDPAHE